MKLLKNLPLKFDRHFSKGLLQQVLWLLGMMVVAYALLTCLSYADCLYSKEAEVGDHWMNRFFDIMFVLMNPGPGTDSMSYTFAVICSIVGLIIFSGMLISVISNVLERRVESYTNGDTTYEMKDHVVIIGYDDSVPSLLRHLRTDPRYANSLIAIMSNREATDIRSLLHAGVGETLDRNIVVMHCTGNSREELERLSIPHCLTIYIIGDANAQAHDSINFETMRQVAAIWKEGHPCQTEKEATKTASKKANEAASKDAVKPKRLDCHFMFERQTTYGVFQFSSLPKEITESLRFHPFNVNEDWAKRVLVEGPVKGTYKPLEGDEPMTAQSQKHVHVVIIGMSPMGIAMGVETAQVSHYPNFREEDVTTRTHITFIDSEAGSGMRYFKSRFESMFDLARQRYAEGEGITYSLTDGWTDPIASADSPYQHLGPNFIDLEWEFLQGNADDSAVRQYLKDAANDHSAVTTIIVCQPTDQQSITTAMYLPDSVLRQSHQILVCQRESSALASNINNPLDHCTRFDRIQPFGMTTDIFSHNKIGEQEGKWINAFYAKEFGDDKTKQKWERMHTPWADNEWEGLAVADRWSSIHCANTIYAKLRTMGLKPTDSEETILAQIEANATDIIHTEHNRWNAEQLLSGYRPVFKDEWDAFITKQTGSKDKAKRSHANICSNKMLRESSLLVKGDANKFHSLDYAVACAIPRILAQTYHKS